ncbi:carbonic anhydrase family protein [Undibacterium luofuense]|uniref:carbonic anhydrase family protein n=1 Tax=Undibacterium luofuense TaxID=2828733 RepID=UPI0030EDB7B2
MSLFPVLRKSAIALAMLGTVGAGVVVSPVAFADAVVSIPMTKDSQAKVTPDEAIQRLKEGNARFLSGTMLKRDLISQTKTAGSQGQFPFVSIVSCIDSRSDPALVFDQGIGDMFTARVAGNIVNEDILGSLEYASKVAGSKAIVVVGHTHCGAVKGACDNVKMGNLTALIEKIAPAVKATPNVHGDDRSSKNHHLVDAAAETNVRMTVKSILDKSPVLKEMVDKGQIKVIGAMHDVETGKVDFLN